MEMCHDCPHRRENEVGDFILIVKDSKGKMLEVAHPCHNSAKVKCEGHRRTLERIKLGVVQVEDFQEQYTICGPFNQGGA